MADDEKALDENSEPSAEAPEEPSAEETPAAEPAEDTPAEETPAEETPAEEAAEDADPAPVAEEQGENTAPADEAAAEQIEEEPAAEEPAAEEAPAEEEPAEEPAPAEKKKDVIPGADLEPILVEDGPALSAEEKAAQEAEEEEKARREAALTADDADDDAATSRAPAKMESGSRFLATGKRKRSIARVTLVPGDGKIEINKRSIEEFFPRPLHQTMARQPLTVSGYEGNVDVRVRVHGGGISGQAGAVRHGIARALTEIDPELRGDLKRRGFLTRDARVKERRKAGFKKARKKPQFSKR
jgi:small subunit ribosomal protein S9